MPPFRAICRGLRCLSVSDLVANAPLRLFVSGANFWRLVLRELYSGSTDAERGPLVGPIKRYALASHEVGDAEGFRRWSMNATQCASAHKIAVNCQPMSALGGGLNRSPQHSTLEGKGVYCDATGTFSGVYCGR
jgi:hypothetical protein